MKDLSANVAYIDAQLKDGTAELRAIEIYSYDLIRDPFFDNKTLVCFLMAHPLGDFCHWSNRCTEFELLINQADFLQQKDYMVAYSGCRFMNLSLQQNLETEPLQVKIAFTSSERIPACYVCHMGQILRSGKRVWLLDESILCAEHELQLALKV